LQADEKTEGKKAPILQKKVVVASNDLEEQLGLDRDASAIIRPALWG